jgi:sigma-B regulation protein RsbU (phosphoserine phosphatase)
VSAVALQTPAPAAATPAPLAEARILVVDDSATVRAVIGAYLRDHGFRHILFARDGNEALALAATLKPELVITDLVMPGLDGFALCRRLVTLPDMADVPILVLTGLAQSGERAKVFAAGASDLITKPVDPIEMVGRVRLHLERRRLIADLSLYQARMAAELEQARQMQQGLLPGRRDITRLKAELPVDIAATYEASLGLGGDIWGLKRLGAARLRLFIADFTGHGVGAALNTFRLHSYLHNAPADTDDPARLLAYLNTCLAQVLPTGQFATMFAAVIDFAAGTLTHAGAASPPALIRDPASGRFTLVDGSGFPLGINKRATYDSVTRPFPVGAALILYSDALIETPEPPNQRFTPESLCDFLNAGREPASAAMLRALPVAELRKTGAALADDLTVVALCHTGHHAPKAAP